MSSEVRVLSLPGLTAFKEAHALQLDLVDQRAAEKIPDTLIFCEHPSVFTRGRGLQYSSERTVKQMATTVPTLEVERGGDLTWHGPGQLVVYPIFKLNGKHAPREDVGAWIRQLEKWVIQVCAEWGVRCFTKKDATGIWCWQGDTEKKLASVGIAIRKWVSFHGLALNYAADLREFKKIQPCGFSGEVMANLDAAQTPTRLTLESIFYRVICDRSVFLEKITSVP